ncbi:FAD-binding oxidoreductase [Baekduia soli]|uniref:FAD-binding oxidoreductase n=1 Tax=Baekduia soli TaxID=496014 RepID=A0A5B8U8L7_9ACTN|nr:FAD-binding oxidoreductase [Baekduia soli]QEC49466.1 FAD-binding oxidoreductase [Baekduia soli]
MIITARPDLGLDSLRSRFAGELHAPGDAGYDDARQAWNLAVDQRPALVALPRDADDVSALMGFARANALRIAPQGTGHNANARGSVADSILVRTTLMRGVEIDPVARRARVEAGALWMDVTAPASEHGLAALAGSSPDVGVVGYTLGGGIGWLARALGLACNSVTAIEVVTADGEQLRCDEDRHPELFWALRGGTGSFGVITALELELFPLPEVYQGVMLWPWERSREILRAWHEWTLDAPEAVTTSARILQIPPMPDIPEAFRGRQFVAIDGAVMGTEAYAAEVLAPLRALEPAMDLFAMAPPAGLVHVHMDPEHPVPGIGGHAMLDELTPEAIDALVDVAGPGTDSPMLAVELRHLGGALARVPARAGATARLEAAYILFAVGVPVTPELAEAIPARLAALKAAVAPWAAERVYLNFAEEPTDTRSAYGEDAFAALQAVKAEYDPFDLIHANHPIAPASR